VALDADWSALRIRRVERIESFTRRASMTVSTSGRSRAGGRVPKSNGD